MIRQPRWCRGAFPATGHGASTPPFAQPNDKDLTSLESNDAVPTIDLISEEDKEEEECEEAEEEDKVEIMIGQPRATGHGAASFDNMDLTNLALGHALQMQFERSLMELPF